MKVKPPQPPTITCFELKANVRGPHRNWLLDLLCHGFPHDQHDFRMQYDPARHSAQPGRLRSLLLTTAPPHELRPALHILGRTWQQIPHPTTKPYGANYSAVLYQRASSEPVQITPDLTLWAVYPLPETPPETPMLAFLRQVPHPWQLSIRLHPTTPTAHELTFVQRQLAHLTTLQARCPGATPPLLTRSSDALNAWHDRLHRTCAALTITLSAPQPISHALAHAHRTWLTGNTNTLEITRLDAQETRAAQQAHHTLSPAQPTYSKAPQGLERLPTLVTPAELTALLSPVLHGPTLNRPAKPHQPPKPAKTTKHFASIPGGPTPTANTHPQEEP